MKTYKVKNYKGNLVESLKKFSDSHKGMKIVEACEDGDDLKIKAEESAENTSIKEEVEPSDVGENGFVEYAFKPKTLDVDTVLEILNKFKKEHGNTGVVVWYNNPDNKYRITYSPSRNLVCFWAMKHFG